MINGRGALIIDSDENLETISIISNTCRVIDIHKKITIEASN